MKDDDSGIRRVVDLYVNCSYPMRPDVLAASDTCQHPADTAVVDGEYRLYRCPDHRGQVKPGQRGEVVTVVKVRWPS